MTFKNIRHRKTTEHTTIRTDLTNISRENTKKRIEISEMSEEKIEREQAEVEKEKRIVEDEREIAEEEGGETHQDCRESRKKTCEKCGTEWHGFGTLCAQCRVASSKIMICAICSKRVFPPQMAEKMEKNEDGIETVVYYHKRCLERGDVAPSGALIHDEEGGNSSIKNKARYEIDYSKPPTVHEQIIKHSIKVETTPHPPSGDAPEEAQDEKVEDQASAPPKEEEDKEEEEQKVSAGENSNKSYMTAEEPEGRPSVSKDSIVFESPRPSSKEEVRGRGPFGIVATDSDIPDIEDLHAAIKAGKTSSKTSDRGKPIRTQRCADTGEVTFVKGDSKEDLHMLREV